MTRRPAPRRPNRTNGRPDPLDEAMGSASDPAAAMADAVSPPTAPTPSGPTVPGPAATTPNPIAAAAATSHTGHPIDGTGAKRTEAMDHEKTDVWATMSPLDTIDSLSNPVMLADADMVIRHVNEAGYRMFEDIEADIRRDMPQFRARDVVGKNMEVFHRNPDYQRGLLSGLTKTHEGGFTLGGRHLTFRATPKRIGGAANGCYLVEWQDQTEVVHAKTQIEKLLIDIRAMVSAHHAGDIDHFVEPEGFDPAFAAVVNDINAMVLEHINTKKKVVACLAEIARGNFSAKLETFPRKKAFLNEVVESIRHNFTAVIGEIERLSNAIVDGTLDVAPDRARFQGDFIRIVDAFDSAFAGLNGAFGRIGGQITLVATTVEQLSQSSKSLATNSQIQSSSVDEVSASAEETDAQVKSNAAAAAKASQLVVGASEVAAVGKGKINEMVNAMQGIRASSQDIAKIIKVIDEIAFQTNLLALNAAVEAARAGQHGRGFAVVAQEVRNLAGRSAKAARETSELIEDAATRVQSGVKIADETSKAFVSIADDIEKVKSLVTEIATASDEQSRGVAQINIAIGEIAKSALATSQQAEELAASSDQMASVTDGMRAEIARYRLRQMDTAPEIAGLSLDGVSADLMAQIQAMIAGQMGGQRPAPAPARTAANGGTNSDRDRRGFGNF